MFHPHKETTILGSLPNFNVFFGWWANQNGPLLPKNKKQNLASKPFNE
jgi:hypothetical protein